MSRIQHPPELVPAAYYSIWDCPSQGRDFFFFQPLTFEAVDAILESRARRRRLGATRWTPGRPLLKGHCNETH